ncbi:MAG: hypothetical protein ACJ790_23130 [Myxococcaceae bacterium]
MNARGKVGVLHVILLAALLGAAFWGINYGPVYLDNSELKQAAQETFNRAKIKEYPDEQLMRLFFEKSNGGGGNPGVGTHVEVDQYGVSSVKPGLALKTENARIVRDEVHSILSVEVDYQRTITLWPTKKEKTLTFHIVKEGPLR